MGLGTGCGFLGIVLHELGHTLGMGHEQARKDRDKFVEIHKENVKDETIFNNNFAILDEAYQETPYDVLSLMHYGAWEFSSNSGETITTVIPELQQYLGQREGFSEYDIRQIGTMYGCADTVKPIVTNAKLAADLIQGKSL